MGNVTVKVNPAGRQALRLGLALGLYELADATVKRADSGKPRKADSGAVALLDGQVVAGPAPVPRGAQGGEIVAYAGFGFPSRFVEFGTAAHREQPRSARVLAGVGQVFGRSVQHPGTAARPFITPATQAVVGSALALLKAGIGRRWRP